MINELKRKLWLISLSMPYVVPLINDLEVIRKEHGFWKKINKGQFELTSFILMGIPKIKRSENEADYRNRIRIYCQETLGIYDQVQFNNQIKRYITGSSIANDFNYKRRQISGLPLEQRKSFLKQTKEESLEFFKYSIVMQYDNSLPVGGIKGYDIAKVISLYRIGLSLGYLDVEEFFDNLLQVGEIAKENYISFYEYGISVAVGQIYESGYLNYDKIIEKLHFCNTDKDSYWRNISWDYIDLK